MRELRHMCRAMAKQGRFDPDLCPLLKGLSPDEIRAAMDQNPHIRACALAVCDDDLDPASRMDLCRSSIKTIKSRGTEFTGVG